jgi:oligo-1,6-glucosidase
MTLFFENHDNPRMISKVNPDPQHRVALGKLLGTLLLTMRGTPFLFQGQELAAVNQPFENLAEVQDVESHNRYRSLVGAGMSEEEAWAQVLTSSRDHSRVPMAWSSEPGGGFTTGTPWMTGRDDPGFSVMDQADDPESVLNHYRRLLALRRRSRALRLGEVEFVDVNRPGYSAWFRRAGNERLFVQLNLTEKPLQVPAIGLAAELVISSHAIRQDHVLAPYESRVYLRGDTPPQQGWSMARGQGARSNVAAAARVGRVVLLPLVGGLGMAADGLRGLLQRPLKRLARPTIVGIAAGASARAHRKR